MQNILGFRAGLASLLVFASLTASPVRAGESATNGVYGGYVGSDRWFSEMRRSAANQAMMQQLARTRDYRRLPAGYVEGAGRIVFPKGNPFPKKQLPDLRIRCRNQKADPVERAPFIDRQGGFYTVLKKGQTYDFYWMYYFGSREQFASLAIKPGAPRQCRFTIEYRPSASIHTGTQELKEERSKGELLKPKDADQFDLSGFPQQPTSFEEQQVMEAIDSAATPALKADAHERLARYYEKAGDTQKAKSEHAKAEYWRSVK